MTVSKHKPSIVFLCGLLCDEFVWQQIAESLSDVADTTIMNFQGYNSITAMAENVLALSPDKFALAGHSMGGRVVLESYRLAPHRIDRITLLNTGVHPKRDSEIPGRQKLLDLAATKGMEAVADTWLPPMIGPQAQQNASLVQQLRQMVCRHSAGEFQGQITALLNRPDARQVLAHITVPALLVSAEDDHWSPVSQHQSMLESIEHARHIKLSNTGHMSTVEAPLEISAALREWLTW